MNNQFLNNYNESPFLNQIDVKKYSNKILSYSLMWFGLAVSFIILFSFSILKIDFLKEKYLSIFKWTLSRGISTIIISIIVMLLNFGLYTFIIFAAKKRNIPIFVFVISYILFIILETFWIPLLLNGLDNTSIILVFLIPTCCIALTGVLGYFRIINFEKWLPLITGAAIISIIVGFISFFISNSFINGLYSFLGVFISLGISGFTFYNMKSETVRIINQFRGDEKEIKNFMIREGLVNGLMLFVAFIRILMEVLRFVKK